MFIERYKLTRNPFADDSERPIYVSHSMRRAAMQIRRIFHGELETLALSGARGVGKTTLLTQHIGRYDDVGSSMVSPDIDGARAALCKLQKDIGPGVTEGSERELRNILSVYLKHQRGNDRLSVVVIDRLEDQPPDVMQEIQSLFGNRVKGLPLIQIIALTRREKRAEEWIAPYENARLVRASHSTLTGFTVDETGQYIRACLHEAGCDWADELLPEHVLYDIHAFTHGVVRDINGLCAELLNILARTDRSGGRINTRTEAALRAVAAKLHLRREPDEIERATDDLPRDPIRDLGKRRDLRLKSARLVVSRKGVTLSEIPLDKPRMVLGRDEGCDISFDSGFLSRYQNLFMHTGDGWMLIDLNSTNGCFVNGRRVISHLLKDGDTIGVGKHQLVFAGPDGVTGSTGGDRGDDTIIVGEPNSL